MKTDGSNMALQKKPVQQQGQLTLKQWVVKNTDQIKNALPKNITPERMVRIALTALTKDTKLTACTPASFMGAVLTSAQLGLECNTPLGQAYLIPYNERGIMTAHFQLGYQGVLDLCYRSKLYKTIQARIVYEGDEFEYEYGFNERLYHKPCGKYEKPTHVYAFYELLGGGRGAEVLSWEAVLAHAKKYSQSRAGSSSPWDTAPESMAMKTVLKKVLKFAPKSVEVAEAITSDNAVINVRKESEGGSEWLAKDVEIPAGDDAQETPPPPDAKELAKEAITQNEQNNQAEAKAEPKGLLSDF